MVKHNFIVKAKKYNWVPFSFFRINLPLFLPLPCPSLSISLTLSLFSLSFFLSLDKGVIFDNMEIEDFYFSLIFVSHILLSFLIYHTQLFFPPGTVTIFIFLSKNFHLRKVISFSFSLFLAFFLSLPQLCSYHIFSSLSLSFSSNYFIPTGMVIICIFFFGIPLHASCLSSFPFSSFFLSIHLFLFLWLCICTSILIFQIIYSLLFLCLPYPTLSFLLVIFMILWRQENPFLQLSESVIGQLVIYMLTEDAGPGSTVLYLGNKLGSGTEHCII